jgi:hypothetical protein
VADSGLLANLINSIKSLMFVTIAAGYALSCWPASAPPAELLLSYSLCCCHLCFRTTFDMLRRYAALLPSAA